MLSEPARARRWLCGRAGCRCAIITSIAGHLPHRDHTDAFWNEVDKILGDWRERKQWLRRYGAGLDA